MENIVADRATIEAISGKAAAQGAMFAKEAKDLANQGRAFMAELAWAKCEGMNAFSLELQQIADRLPGGPLAKAG